ncbi:MAG: radical SAM protein [Candidatus Aureabacteria bacterium]|nr:radical SAM protein [Candidatus Auribacterota bacterium]
MNIKRALLIYPPTGLYDRFDRCQAPIESEAVFMIRPPMDLAYMAAALERAGVECTIKDYPAEKKGWSEFERDLKQLAPDLLIASTVAPTFDKDCRAFAIAKCTDPRIMTIAKGVISADKGKIEMARHPEIDILIRGEPEFIITEIAPGRDLSQVNGITYRKGQQIIVNPDRPGLENLDELPFPARHLLKNNLYLMPDTRKRMGLILTSKGCPFECIFCLVPNLYGRNVVFRSPASLVDEIEQCVSKYDIRDFWFRADTFTLKKPWVVEVCRRIIEKNLRIRWATNSRVDTIDDERLDWMKRAGCFAIGFGIESGSQAILDMMKKGITLDQCREAVRLCKEKEILTYLFFMIGLPWETRETVRQTVAFAKELDGDISNFSIACPFPGSELHKIAVENRLIDKRSAVRGDYSTPSMGTLYLSAGEVARLEKWANRKLLLRPIHTIRVFKKLKSVPMMITYATAGLRMLRYSFTSSRRP